MKKIKLLILLSMSMSMLFLGKANIYAMNDGQKNGAFINNQLPNEKQQIIEIDENLSPDDKLRALLKNRSELYSDSSYVFDEERSEEMFELVQRLYGELQTCGFAQKQGIVQFMGSETRKKHLQLILEKLLNLVSKVLGLRDKLAKDCLENVDNLRLKRSTDNREEVRKEVDALNAAFEYAFFRSSNRKFTECAIKACGAREAKVRLECYENFRNIALKAVPILKEYIKAAEEFRKKDNGNDAKQESKQQQQNGIIKQDLKQQQQNEFIEPEPKQQQQNGIIKQDLKQHQQNGIIKQDLKQHQQNKFIELEPEQQQQNEFIEQEPEQQQQNGIIKQESKQQQQNGIIKQEPEQQQQYNDDSSFNQELENSLNQIFNGQSNELEGFNNNINYNNMDNKTYRSHLKQQQCNYNKEFENGFNQIFNGRSSKLGNDFDIFKETNSEFENILDRGGVLFGNGSLNAYSNNFLRNRTIRLLQQPQEDDYLKKILQNKRGNSNKNY